MLSEGAERMTNQPQNRDYEDAARRRAHQCLMDALAFAERARASLNVGGDPSVVAYIYADNVRGFEAAIARAREYMIGH